MDTTHVRLLQKNFKCQLASMPKGELTKLPGGVFCFPAQHLDLGGDVSINKRNAILENFGLIKYLDFQFPKGASLKSAMWQVPLFNIFGFKHWNKIYFNRMHAKISIENYIPGEVTRPLDFHELHLEGKSTAGEGPRIAHLIEHVLVFIDERENGPSKLYQDPKDGRYFQWMKDPSTGALSLTHVTYPQWQYEYLENKLNPRNGGHSEDEYFYENLEEDPGKRSCEMKGCPHISIKYGSLCRDHHFEAIKGLAYTKSSKSQDFQ